MHLPSFPALAGFSPVSQSVDIALSPPLSLLFDSAEGSEEKWWKLSW